MASNKIIGIDLGTTNSAVAVLEVMNLRLSPLLKVAGRFLQLWHSKMAKLKLVKLSLIHI